jgi:hypothetical protein
VHYAPNRDFYAHEHPLHTMLELVCISLFALRIDNSEKSEVDPKGWTKFGRRLDGAAG